MHFAVVSGEMFSLQDNELFTLFAAPASSPTCNITQMPRLVIFLILRRTFLPLSVPTRQLFIFGKTNELIWFKNRFLRSVQATSSMPSPVWPSATVCLQVSCMQVWERICIERYLPTIRPNCLRVVFGKVLVSVLVQYPCALGHMGILCRAVQFYGRRISGGRPNLFFGPSVDPFAPNNFECSGGNSVRENNNKQETILN